MSFIHNAYIGMNDDDILDHPLFQDHVPAELNGAHPAYMALAHLSSSSSGEDHDAGALKKVTHAKLRKTITKPNKTKKNPRSSAVDKQLKELDFVCRNWKPLAKSKDK